MPASDDRLTRIEDKLNKLVDKSKNVDDLVQNNKSLFKQLEDVKKEFQEMNKKNDKIMKDFAEMQKNVHFLQAENLTLKKELSDIRICVEEMRYRELENKAEITGIPEVVGENLKQSILDVATKIGVKMDDNDITMVQRVKQRIGVESKIHVTLKNVMLRDTFLQNGKKKRLKLSYSNPSDNGNKDHNIYFNEVLSSYTKKLFYEARLLKRERNYRYAWEKKGRVYVKKSENENAILLKNLNEIVTLRA